MSHPSKAVAIDVSEKQNIVALGNRAVDDDVFTDVYKQVSNQIKALIVHGNLDVTNIDELFKDVMEAVEAIQNHHVISGTQKAAMAKGLLLQVLKDVYDDGKIDKGLYETAVALVETFGPVIFKLVSLASKGLIHINDMIGDAIENSACCQKCQTKCNIL